MEVLPCSRVAHIERTKKPYNNDIDYYAKRNALRAAEVWMDSFKSHVYMAWNIPMTVSGAAGEPGRAGPRGRGRARPGRRRTRQQPGATPAQSGAVWERAPRMPAQPVRSPTLFGWSFCWQKVLPMAASEGWLFPTSAHCADTAHQELHPQMCGQGSASAAWPVPGCSLPASAHDVRGVGLGSVVRYTG